MWVVVWCGVVVVIVLLARVELDGLVVNRILGDLLGCGLYARGYCYYGVDALWVGDGLFDRLYAVYGVIDYVCLRGDI